MGPSLPPFPSLLKSSLLFVGTWVSRGGMNPQVGWPTWALGETPFYTREGEVESSRIECSEKLKEHLMAEGGASYVRLLSRSRVRFTLKLSTWELSPFATFGSRLDDGSRSVHITYSETKATLGGPTKNISLTYSPEILGWDFNWLELLVAGYPPSSTHSNSSSQLKSQLCIFREYVGLMFWWLELLGFLVWPLYEGGAEAFITMCSPCITIWSQFNT